MVPQYKEKGDDSDLHIIIFDELDAITKQRGSTNSGTGVGDTVVNQLLSKVIQSSPYGISLTVSLDGRCGPTKQRSHYRNDQSA